MAERPILSVAAVKQQLPRLENFLSKADFDRLEALLPLFTPQQASKADLAACLATVAAGRTTQEQLADFRAFPHGYDRPRARLDSHGHSRWIRRNVRPRQAVCAGSRNQRLTALPMTLPGFLKGLLPAWTPPRLLNRVRWYL
jgi:hypothetical protein